MKYKIRYLFNKFYHLIKFIIPTFFVGMFSVNANVVPYECRQYDYYFNVASVYNNNSTSYLEDRSANFYNLQVGTTDTHNPPRLEIWHTGSFVAIEKAYSTYINTCTSQYTDENTGEVEVQNNYELREIVSTTSNNTADLVSMLNRNSTGDYFSLRIENLNYMSSNSYSAFNIDKSKDKIIYPMYFRSNKNDLQITDIFEKIIFSIQLGRTDGSGNTIFNFDSSNYNNEDIFKNFTIYYEENYFYYYTFDLVVPLTDFPTDYYYLPYNNVGNGATQGISVELYPNKTFLQAQENQPLGIFMGFSTAFFISDKVISAPNWIETGIDEWVITNNPSETLGPLEEFFNNFNLQDNRGISQIITIPIRIVQSFLSSSCDSISIDIFTSRNDDNLTIQSGCSFWNTMTPLKNLLNIFVDGFICFEILKAIYLEIDKLKDPSDKSKVERSDL